MKNVIVTAIITAGIVALVIHFIPVHSPTPTFRTMSPTDLFNLNGKCAQLAEKLSETEGRHGDAISGDHSSHYNPRTNRCYVLLSTWKNFTFDHSGYKSYTPLPDDYRSDALYDAQTGAQLIHALRMQGKASAFGWDGTSEVHDISFEEAEAKMQELMHEGDVKP